MVTLTFTGGPSLPGFQSYVIMRDGRHVDDRPAAATSWRDGPLDPGTQYCYEVFAMVRGAAPSPQRTAPAACVRPTGK